MDSTTRPVSPLRQRMIDDLRMRKLGEKTQSAYVRAVRNFAEFLGRSPETASAEDVRRFQLHMVDCGVSPITITSTRNTPSVLTGVVPTENSAAFSHASTCSQESSTALFKEVLPRGARRRGGGGD